MARNNLFSADMQSDRKLRSIIPVSTQAIIRDRYDVIVAGKSDAALSKTVQQDQPPYLSVVVIYLVLNIRENITFWKRWGLGC